MNRQKERGDVGVDRNVHRASDLDLNRDMSLDVNEEADEDLLMQTPVLRVPGTGSSSSSGSASGRRL